MWLFPGCGGCRALVESGILENAQVAQRAMQAAARRQSILKAAGNAGLLQEAGELSSGSSKASLKAGTPKKQPPSQPASTPHHEPTKRCRAKTTPVPKQDQTPSTMTPAAKQAKPNELATPPPTGKKLVFDDAGTSSEV